MPRPFQFRLEKVLEYRRQLEETAQQVLARARMDEARQEARLRDLTISLEEGEKRLASQSRLTAGDIWLWRNYRTRLLDEIREAEARLIQMARIAEKRRLEVLKASKDKKLLEKLKEKQAKRHEWDQLHREQEAFDEMATIRFSHQSL
ncbi:MAG: flagellar export protein FliJ [Deltaproteobacteria bacterium]|nr:flagellar export protein FliJ [Deltaproteobacteria bacterium]